MAAVSHERMEAYMGEMEMEKTGQETDSRVIE